MPRSRWIPTVLITSVAAVCLVLAALVPAGAAGPVQLVDYGQVSCSLDSGGRCTVQHQLGVAPAAVVVSPNTPPGWNGFMLNTIRDSFTATSFRVRAMSTQTQPKNGGTIWFSYVAYAVGQPTPPPTTEPTAVPPITTTTTTTVPTTTPAPGGYPTPSTTGTPAGTVLSDHNGDFHATVAGQVIDRLHITGALFVEAPSVVIRNSQVDNEIQNWRDANSSFTVEDSVIGPASGCVYQAGIYGHHFTVLRTHIRNKVNGFTLTDGGGAVVRDSFIRACTPPGDDSHSDGFETCCGPLDEVYDHITLDHNTIDLRGGTSVTAAIDLDQARFQRFTSVTNNLLGGGAYEMYLYNPLTPSATSPAWTVAGNKFIDQGWAFGPLTTRDNTCANIAWGPGNDVVTVDSEYRITGTVRALSCNS